MCAYHFASRLLTMNSFGGSEPESDRLIARCHLCAWVHELDRAPVIPSFCRGYINFGGQVQRTQHHDFFNVKRTSKNSARSFEKTSTVPLRLIRLSRVTRAFDETPCNVSQALTTNQ